MTSRLLLTDRCQVGNLLHLYYLLFSDETLFLLFVLKGKICQVRVFESIQFQSGLLQVFTTVLLSFCRACGANHTRNQSAR